jgi:Cu(I)/Ag(I) efflux system membrane fusion protein
MRTIAWIAAAALAASGLAAGYWLGTHKEQTGSAAQGASTPGKKILYYRNPMGLPDTSPMPKKDPMGMDYIAVYEGEQPAQSLPPGTVKISIDKVQILGVKTEAVQRRELKHTVHAVGTIQPNERLTYKVAPRFEGWIERLHVNSTGQQVARGQALMEIYSPDLVAAQEEYLIALRGAGDLKGGDAEAQATMQRLAEGVLRRLRNWDVSGRELERLQREGKPQRLLAYRSPVGGVVLQKPSVQGMRFMPGDVLYEIADLSSVWLIADVAEQELGQIHPGQDAAVRIVAYPERAFDGKVVFIYPTLEAATRTARVRIELANRAGMLKPAMYGNVTIGAGMMGSQALAVPDSAVLDSGTRQIVLVRRGEGLFEPRNVAIGMRADSYVEVRDGLREGEEVVVRANFLIDAESNLKAALDSFGRPAAQTHRGSGTVQSVDAAAGTLEVEHNAIPTLQWPAMTMEFKAKDKALLAELKPGDRIEFELSPGEPGEFLIVRVAPAVTGGHPAHGGS